jgi:hypothetical protein
VNETTERHVAELEVLLCGCCGSRQREALDAAIRALRQGGGEAVAWEWERFQSDTIGGGFWIKEWDEEYPQILHQEDLSDPERYRNVRPLYTSPAPAGRDEA